MNTQSVTLFNSEGRYRTLKNLYKALTDEEKRFIETQQLDAGHSVRYWQKFFQRLIQLDVVGAQLRQFYGKMSWLLFLLNIVGVIVLNLMGLFPVFCALFAVLLFSWFRLYRCKKMDVDNDIRTDLVKLFQVLELETRYIELKLDLKPINKRIAEREEIPNKNTKLAYFEIPVMQLIAHLKDGNNLKVSIDDINCRRIRKQRSRSGKIKTKTKFKGRRLIRVDLGLNTLRYEKRPGKLAQDSKYVANDGKQKIVTQFRFKYDGPKKFLDAENTLKTIAKAYQQTNVITSGVAA